MKYADIVASLGTLAASEDGGSFVTVEKAKLARFAEYLKTCKVTEPKTARELVGELMDNVGIAAVEFGQMSNHTEGVRCKDTAREHFNVNCVEQKNCDACRAACLDDIFDALRDIEAALKEED